MELYSGIDLHSNDHVAIIDDQQNRVFYRKLANDTGDHCKRFCSLSRTAQGGRH